MDSHNEGYDAGVIAGLKEALEIASLIGGTEAARIWQNLIIAAIRSRIEELEKGNANG